jgi:D-alanyl-D-alanine carboxypeptidase
MKKRSKKKRHKILINKIVIFLIISIVLGGLLFIKIYKENNQLQINLISNLNVEINSEVNLLSFIKEIKNGEILTEDTTLNTSKLGTKKLEILIKDKFNKEEKYSFNINIVDTIEPTIKGNAELITYIGKNIDLLKDVSATDNSNEDITVSIEGKYDINNIGEYPLNYIATDSSGNKSTSSFTLKVIKDPNNYTFKTSKGYTAKVIDGITYIDGILIANKTYKLPSSYGSGLTKETKNAFNLMDADATALGLNLYISSGYRSYYDQKYIYNNYVKKDGQKEADTYSARAGHSEHQTGLAFDLNSINDSFTNTPEGKWVHDNCYKYGLILRYPKGKDDITGYMHESWHLRYVGIDLATKLYNNGNWITLEEYFGIDSKYNN